MDINDIEAAESAAEGYSRIALGVEYKGSRYRGWQRQASGVPSVQQALEQALSTVANEPISVICAGRTDAGVHGCGQIVHFDTRAVRDERAGPWAPISICPTTSVSPGHGRCLRISMPGSRPWHGAIVMSSTTTRSAPRTWPRRSPEPSAAGCRAHGRGGAVPAGDP